MIINNCFLKALLLVVAIVAAAMPVSAYDFMVNGICYNKNSDGKSVTVTYQLLSSPRYSNLSGALNIPATVTYGGKTYSVTDIHSEAFDLCEGLTSVIIPNSVKSIGHFAFRNCSGLTSVIIPNSVTDVGLYAFYGTAWYNNQPNGLVYAGMVAYSYKGTMPVGTTIVLKDGCTGITPRTFENQTGLASIIIPNSVISIGVDAFRGCTGLLSVTIPNSVKYLSGFRDCTGLTSITIPNSVTEIGYEAFYSCTGLTSITIPNSVTEIGYEAFYSCTGLTSIDIPNSVTSVGTRAFDNCTGLTSVTIGSQVTSIGYEAFDGCTGLTSVILNSNAIVSQNYADYSIRNIFGSQVKEYIIGNSVTSIGLNAFTSCKDLISVIIGNSVTSIHENAFAGCLSLTSVNIPNSVTSIGHGAFSFTSLTSVTIPQSLESIGGSVFSFCSKLDTVIWNAVNCNFDKWGNDHPFCSSSIKTLIIGNDVETIPLGLCYALTDLTSLSIGRAVTNIGYLFSGTYHLTDLIWNAVNCPTKSNIPTESVKNVVIGNEVEVLPEGFVAGSQITSVIIPNSVTSIGNTAFKGCRYLVGDMIIPNSVISIGDSAYLECSGLTSVTIPNSVTLIRSSVFNGCSGLTSLEIPSSITTIGDYAFSGCSGLASVTIPNSVTSIGSAAFNGCTGLTSVIFGNSVTSIGSAAFNGCTGLTSVTFGNSVTSIAGNSSQDGLDGAFSGCTGLTSVTIPSSVTSIGFGAFSNCTDLTTVEINSNAILSKHYDWSNSISRIFGSQVNNYILGDDVTSIGSKVFSDCSGLNSIIISNSVTSIGDNAFSGCTGLTSVTIPNSVMTIGDDTFHGCSGLTELTIGNSVTSIGNSAFNRCSGLTQILSQIENPQNVAMGNIVFYGIDKSSCTLYVPDGTVELYKSTPQWKDFYNINVSAITNVAVDEPIIKVMDGHINVTGANDVKVYNLNGTLVGSSSDSNVTPGVYIVIVNGKRTKIIVR